MLVHAALAVLMALIFLGHHSEIPVDATITIDGIFHQAIHRIGIPHTEPRVRRTELATDAETTHSDHHSENPMGIPSEDETSGTGIAPTELQKYFLELLERIHRSKKYPRDAQFNEQEGVVQVLLKVAPDGEILRVELEKECPFPSLNQAGLTAVQNLGRLSPLPKNTSGELPVRPITLHIPIHFKLK